MINKTKIVATLGPASESIETKKKMVAAGVNVFRINFSHGTHDQHRENIRQIKRLNEENNWNLAILADLQGPKLRIGDIEPGTILENGESFTLTNEKMVGNRNIAYINYEKLPIDANPGERILLDDGKLILRVTGTDRKTKVTTEVEQGGPLNPRKGVNLPNTYISLPCLTKKDIEDLKVALENEVEWIGLSFVRNANDILELKDLAKSWGYEVNVIAKIEKPEAVRDIDEIITVTDAIMVARGDLGVEVPIEQVPLIQKSIVQKCHMASKPVIIATQMMESMMEHLTPSRAEANDVANSVMDGADAMMLSGETSVGKHPVEVVQMMHKIIHHIEDTHHIKVKEENPPRIRNDRYITDSICYNASKIADQIGARAIFTMTFSGYTAFKVSAHRPKTNILVFTANRKILNMLNLIWGVRGFYYDNMQSTDGTFADIKTMMVKQGIVKKGDLVVKIASMPIEDQGMTNMLKITKV